VFAVEGFWLQIGQCFLDVLKRPKIKAKIRILPVFSCINEVEKHGGATRLAKHVRFEFRGKAILGEIIFAGEKRHVFSLRIYEKVPILGAN